MEELVRQLITALQQTNEYLKSISQSLDSMANNGINTFEQNVNVQPK